MNAFHRAHGVHSIAARTQHKNAYLFCGEARPRRWDSLGATSPSSSFHMRREGWAAKTQSQKDTVRRSGSGGGVIGAYPVRRGRRTRRERMRAAWAVDSRLREPRRAAWAWRHGRSRVGGASISGNPAAEADGQWSVAVVALAHPRPYPLVYILRFLNTCRIFIKICVDTFILKTTNTD
jgi:hypothetical protein